MPPARPISERFEEKIDRDRSTIFWNGTKCHEWTGCVMKGGYGQINSGGAAVYAHRVSWELNRGPIKGLFVLHRCDNRKCVNPDHLFLGTFDENMADMVAKNRQAHGMRNGHARLSDEDVLAIRRSTELQSILADRYGVKQPHISMIRSGKTRRIISNDIVFSEPKDSAA